MITRFEINREIFYDNGSIDNCYKYYEKHYKKDGWILDKETENVYMDFNREIYLNILDRVSIHSIGLRQVVWKCIDLELEIIEYALHEE